MITLFRETYKLNTALLTNSIIYRLRKLPLLKHIVPGELYGNEAINAFITIITTMVSIGSKIVSLTLYYGIIILIAYLFNNHFSENMLITFIAFNLTFSIVSIKSLQVSKEKFYAINLMRIDGNQYGIMDFTTLNLINFIASIPVLLILSLFLHFPIYYCFAFPIFQIIVKTISSAGWLKYYQRHKSLLIDKSIFLFPIMGIGILWAGVGMNLSIYIPDMMFMMICTLGLFISFFAYKSILKTTSFKPYFKKKLTLNSVMFNADDIGQITKNSIKKQITYDTSISSKKKGYDFFNDLFFKRHKKILMNSALRFSAIYLFIFIIIIGFLILVPEGKNQAATLLKTHLASFLMIMYFTNRGAKITMAMFVNCDSSMLTYRFYRQPNSLLNLFTQRLKTLLIVNLIPSLVISIGLIVALYMSDSSTSIMNYVLIFIMINAMSIFFSVHYLILYYLLQPYNINLQTKGFLYNIISSLTYIVCYYMMNAKFELFPFTISVIVFCVLYILIALYLVYKMAPKTFHLKN